MDKLLRESGIPFEKINYYIEPLSQKKLTELLRKMKLKPRDLLRKGEAPYKELGLAEDKFSDSELIRIMVENPDLIQRPIVERGDRAVLGRPTENVKELL
jgi:arsenate reductase (glutaredoxin)